MMYVSHIKWHGYSTRARPALEHTHAHKSASVLAHNKVDMITLFIRATNYAHTHTLFASGAQLYDT